MDQKCGVYDASCYHRSISLSTRMACSISGPGWRGYSEDQPASIFSRQLDYVVYTSISCLRVSTQHNLNMQSYMQSLLSATTVFADCRKEPAKWNDQWEQRLKTFGSVNLMRVVFLFLPESTEQILTDHRYRLRLLCELQTRLTATTALFFGREYFESKWLKSSGSYREKHLLEGMVRTCTMMYGMEDHRMHCHEITLPFLEKDGGRGYLRLLKHFMVKDLTSVSKAPIYLPSLEWDRFAMGREECDLSEKELAFKAYHEGIRNTFICEHQYQSIQFTSRPWRYITGQFLFNTLASFHGHSVRPTQIVKHSIRNRFGSAFKNEMVKQLGTLADPVIRLIKQDVAAARTEAKISCESCMKSGERSDFMICSVCKHERDRRIYYCSKLAILTIESSKLVLTNHHIQEMPESRLGISP